MRTYYASDKKRREDVKRKQKEEKRLRRLNKNAAAKSDSVTETNQAPGTDAGNTGTPGDGSASK